MYISDATTDDDTTTTTTTTTATAQTATAPTSTSSQPHHCRHQRNHHQPTCPLLKKRAETWVQDETRSLINFRKDMDSQFNTSKSNKHLWEEISSKMRERGFDRSPTMCTDKWRNLLKEFKKVKHHSRNSGGGGGNGGGGGGGNGFNGSAKMSYYKEIDEILRERNRCSSAAAAMLQNHLDDGGGGGGGHLLKADPFMHFSDKGVDDASIPFGPMEANGRPTLNLETDLDHEGHPLAITAVDTVTGSGVPPSFWRETPGNGGDTHSYGGRVITVKWGDYTRRIGVDGIADAIKDVIRSAFGLRTRRAFWLEDEDQIVRSLDREMPLGTYTLHLDEGMTIKLCHYEDSDHIPFPGQSISHTEEKTFYTEDDFREFMNRRGWSSLRELSGYRNIGNLDDLRPDALYRGMT